MRNYFFVLLLCFFFVEGFSQSSHSSIQTKLQNGTPPKQLLREGVSIDLLYGKIYEGGYIFYFFPEDSSGLVVGQHNLSYKHDTTKKIIWSCRNANTGATETKIGSGLRNSIKIKNVECPLYDADKKVWMPSAAELCLDYSYDGFDDWYLPSKDELHEVYMKLGYTKLVDFKNKGYWSSSEKDNEFAWIEHIKYGPREFELFGQSYYRKFYADFVRPIRTFK